MQILDDLGSGDLSKVRRSIYILSGFVIFFSNATLINDEINFFGLKFRVDQEQLEAVFTLLLWLSLVVFAFRVSESFPLLIARVVKYRDDAWWAPTAREIDAYNEADYQANYHEHEANYHPDWDEEAMMEKERRDKRRDRIESRKEVIILFNIFFGRIAAPLMVAAVAIFRPEAIFALA